VILTSITFGVLGLPVVDLSSVLLQIGDVDRCAVYVSLAPGMENPAGVDLPEDDAAWCHQYTSSEEEQNRPTPTTEDWQWIRPLRRRCRQRAAKHRNVVGSSRSPTTTRRRRRRRHLWFEGRVVVRTLRRPLLVG